ncbi:MAG: hypothetical protein ACYTGZ_09850 [Planctomycetota bacterium]
MKALLSLLLVASLAVAEEYKGKYVGDERLKSIREKLPAQLAEARKRIKVKGDVRIELLDLGAAKSGIVARTRREEDGWAINLFTEPLVLRTHDPQVTLMHELVHCMQRERWGARGEVTMPPWVKEGMAVYLAGQFQDRARTLAAHVGREKVPIELVNGLEGRHTLLDYAEDGAAFIAVELRHGKKKVAAFNEALLSGRPPAAAAREALGERWSAFEESSRKYARATLGRLVTAGRIAVLDLRAKVDAREFKAALQVPRATGVYAAEDAYFRAQALFGVGREADALAILRDGLLEKPVRNSTLLDQAIVLEIELLKSLKRTDEAAAALSRARLDLEPYGASAWLEPPNPK